MYYGYSYSPMVKIITASCLVLLLGACYFFESWISYLLLSPMLVPLIYLPRGYELREDRIVLHCLLWRKTFLLADYEVRALEQEPILGGIRIFASGGTSALRASSGCRSEVAVASSSQISAGLSWS